MKIINIIHNIIKCKNTIKFPILTKTILVQAINDTKLKIFVNVLVIFFIYIRKILFIISSK